jgi:hypothetical protein
VWEKVFATMEEQVPPSQSPAMAQITPEQLEAMKARARELALHQTIAQQSAAPREQPQVVYVRRNLTVAEILVVLAISCGIVTGIQGAWHIATNVLPRIEIKVR